MCEHHKDLPWKRAGDASKRHLSLVNTKFVPHCWTSIGWHLMCDWFQWGTALTSNASLKHGDGCPVLKTVGNRTAVLHFLLSHRGKTFSQISCILLSYFISVLMLLLTEGMTRGWTFSAGNAYSLMFIKQAFVCRLGRFQLDLIFLGGLHFRDHDICPKKSKFKPVWVQPWKGVCAWDVQAFMNRISWNLCWTQTHHDTPGVFNLL